MPAELLKTVFLPLALIVLMFGMGLSLTLVDFKRVFRAPKATLTGLSLQLLGLPLLALAIAHLLGLPPLIAIGLLLVAACPGGATSNLLTHLAKGDTALSVTLTACSSVFTVFTIPLIISAGADHFQTGETSVQVPVVTTLLQLFVITIIPISLGILVHTKKPAFSQRMARPVNIISLVFLALIIFLAVLKEKDLGSQFLIAGPAAVTLNLTAMLLGYLVAKQLRLGAAQQTAITIEVGIQNGTLALAIALGILENATIAMPAVVYSLFMFASGAFILFLRKKVAT